MSSEPERIGDILPRVLAELLERQESRVSPVQEGDSGVAVWENKGGPEGASTPVVPALDQQSCVRGSASRGS